MSRGVSYETAAAGAAKQTQHPQTSNTVPNCKAQRKTRYTTHTYAVASDTRSREKERGNLFSCSFSSSSASSSPGGVPKTKKQASKQAMKHSVQYVFDAAERSTLTQLAGLHRLLAGGLALVGRARGSRVADASRSTKEREREREK